jgi:hypothetical protein
MMTTPRCAVGVSLRKNIDGCSRRAAGHDCDANNSRPELIHINFRGMARWHIDSAGTVLGARVPIILTSRADSVRSRLASCPAAVLYAEARRKGAALPAA